ncbi:hypothetical protein [Bradyrhizobium sp. CCBAU 51627]|uniref:hypothetical protein n=1 Tax=Bradyrhizobium sp. CCBAU 51627 TaxID=1325088 RepID=UPI002305A58F|nr:hypothetical protein [Bradyrhizobium sp. CCBAU 51627]
MEVMTTGSQCGEPGKRAVVDMVASKMKMRAPDSLDVAEMQPGTASHLRVRRDACSNLHTSSASVAVVVHQKICLDARRDG